MADITTATVVQSVQSGDMLFLVRQVSGVATLFQVPATVLQGAAGAAGSANAPVQVVSSASGTLSISTPGNVSYDVTLTGSCVIVPQNGPAGTMSTTIIVLRQDQTAGRACSFAGNVTWAGGLQPPLNTSAGMFDVVQLISFDGQNYSASLIQTQNASLSVPGVPTGASAAAGNGYVAISVNGVASVPPVSGYNIYRSLFSGGETGFPIAFNALMPFVDTNVANETQYYYNITAMNSVGESGRSSEITATPSATAPSGHYATFAAGQIGYIYTPDQAIFNPGGSPFSYRARILPSTASGSANQAIMGVYQPGVPSVSETLFYLTPNGALNVAWINAAGAVCVAASPAAAPFSGSAPLWCRVDVVPLTGAVNFFCSADGVAWTALGATQHAGNSGAVQPGVASSSLIIGSGSANSIPFSGRFYEGLLIINGVVVAHPASGPQATTDTTGLLWITSPTNVTYS